MNNNITINSRNDFIHNSSIFSQENDFENRSTKNIHENIRNTSSNFQKNIFISEKFFANKKNFDEKNNHTSFENLSNQSSNNTKNSTMNQISSQMKTIIDAVIKRVVNKTLLKMSAKPQKFSKSSNSTKMTDETNFQNLAKNVELTMKKSNR